MTIAPTVTNSIDTSPPDIDRHNRPPDTHGAVGEQYPNRGEKLLKWIVPILVLFIFAATAIPDLLQKWLWMGQLHYSEIFWTLLSVKWGMTCVAFIAAFLFLWINIRQAARNSFALAEAEYDAPKGPRLTEKRTSSRYRASQSLAMLSCDSWHSLCLELQRSLRLASTPNGTLISAFDTVVPSMWQTLSLESMSGFTSFVFRSICFCKGAWYS